jgi:hypothetical protein
MCAHSNFILGRGWKEARPTPFPISAGVFRLVRLWPGTKFLVLTGPGLAINSGSDFTYPLSAMSPPTQPCSPFYFIEKFNWEFRKVTINIAK